MISGHAKVLSLFLPHEPIILCLLLDSNHTNCGILAVLSAFPSITLDKL
jgi:hypothetical protein